jgi:hypothetical protein
MVMRGMNHVEKFATSLKNLGHRLTKSQTSKVNSGGESSCKIRKTSDTNTTSSQQSNVLEDAVMGDVVNNQGTVTATSSTTPTEDQPMTIKVGDDFTFPPFTLEGAAVYTPLAILNNEKKRYSGNVGVKHLAAVKKAMIKYKLIAVKSINTTKRTPEET